MGMNCKYFWKVLESFMEIFLLSFVKVICYILLNYLLNKKYCFVSLCFVL